MPAWLGRAFLCGAQGIACLASAPQGWQLGQARDDGDSDAFLRELASLCPYLVAQAAFSTTNVCKKVIQSHLLSSSVFCLKAPC